MKKLWTANPTWTGFGSNLELCTEKQGPNRRAVDRAIAA